MIYSIVEKAGTLILPKRQTLSDWGTQSRWVLMMQDGQAAEESSENSNPKVLPLGFFVKEKASKMRAPRVYKENSVYHITVEASNREVLFRDEADHTYFIELLNNRREKYNFKLHGQRLLNSSFHLLIEPSPDANISKIMQAINTSYSLYFNNKYNRSGHLFSSRYKYELFEKNEDLLAKKIQELAELKEGEVREKAEPSPVYLAKGALEKIESSLMFKAAPVLIGLILISGLVISLKGLPFRSKHNIGKTFAQKETQAAFPQGLPIYSAVNKAQERQVWELWKIGPQE